MIERTARRVRWGVVIGLASLWCHAATAEEYEVVPLDERQEQQYRDSLGKARKGILRKAGKELRFGDAAVQRVGDDGEVLGSLKWPSGAIALFDSRRREFVGYRLGTKVYIVDAAMKVVRSFETPLRSSDMCTVTEDGDIYILRWGFKAERSTGQERRFPPAGFTVYDGKGNAILSETEESGWEIGSLADKAFVVFRRGEGRDAIKVLSYDGKAAWSASVPAEDAYWPQLWWAADSTLMVCWRGKQAWVLSDRLKVLDNVGGALLGELLIVMYNPKPQTLAWEIRDPRKKSSTKAAQVSFDEKKVYSAEGYHDSRLFPGVAGRAVILVRAIPRDQSGGSLLRPVVIDTSSGQIVWSAQPYRPDKLINAKIALGPWEGTERDGPFSV